MQLKVLGSSSKGNCYILENETVSLLIECGVKFSDIKKGLNFSFKKLVGCLLTHEHNDHSKSVEQLLQVGCAVYTSRGTARALGIQISHHRLNIIQAFKIVEIGPFKVLPFAVKHDVVEPLGFIINHPEAGSILFITDSYYVESTFKNLHNIIIEANFSEKIIQEKVAAGASPDFLRNRIFKSHMSLETCKKTLLANDLSKVQKIILIHLSDGNSNAAEFQNEIQGATGKEVLIADSGMNIPIQKKPF